MLTRLMLVPLLVVSAVGSEAAAYAVTGRRSPVVVRTDNHQGEVSTTVFGAGRAGAGHSSASNTSDGSTSRCSWLHVSVSQRLPLPSEISGQRGSWWQQWCNSAGFAGVPVFVPNGAPQAGVLQVSPGTLAQRAANRLQLPTPTVGENPRGQALVGLAEWLWVPRSQWRSLRQRTRAGRVWAAVTARPVTTSWDPGDGSPSLSCDGPGTPYDVNTAASSQSTDCSFTYSRSSADQPQSGRDVNDRAFTVTETTSWSVSWVGSGGTAGTLPGLSRSTSFQLPVAQRQTVVTGGSG